MDEQGSGEDLRGFGEGENHDRNILCENFLVEMFLKYVPIKRFKMKFSNIYYWIYSIK